MADFEQAGESERLRRVAILRDMQAKLKRSSAEALGVAATANPVEVRSAFMALTKQYHPTKFARLDEATVKLANEVFVQLREAYESLATAGNKRARTMPGLGGVEQELAKKPEAGAASGAGGQGGARSNAPAAGASSVRVPDRQPTVSGIGASASAVRAPDKQPTSPGAAPTATSTTSVRAPDKAPAAPVRASDRVAAAAAAAASAAPVRASDRAAAAASSATSSTSPNRAATAAGLGPADVRPPDKSPPPPNPAANGNQGSTGTSSAAPARRPLIGGNRPAGAVGTAPGAAAPTRPSAPSISTSASASGSSGGSGGSARSATPAAPPTRPSSPIITSAPRQPASAAPAAPPTRPSAPSISTSASTSASARPPATGTSSANGPQIRFGASSASSTSSSSSSSSPPTNNNAELARIRGLITRQQWPEARDALQLLLQRAPTDRGCMAQLAYVRGREALELGNVSEARRELLRALSIEPTMEAARITLREINDVTPSSNPSAPRR